MNKSNIHLKSALRSVLLVLLLSAVGMTKMYASYDFSAVCETGQTLYYTITDAENHYVKLTYPGTDFNNGWYGFTKPAGDLVLPESVQYDGLTYSVTSIGDHVFSYCSGLTSIEIPSSVTSIENYTFSSCSGLTSIEIPNSVTSIGTMAFNRCSGLISIEIPNSVTSIGNSAFFLCSSLTSIEIPNLLTSIGSGVFMDCSSLTSIEIPNSVTSIGNSAFSGCSGLTSIVIPNTVTSIGSSAFYGCSHLTSIEIPSSLTIIENSTFSGCRSLTSVEIPNSVTLIGNSAFRGCSGLTSLTFGNSVTSIGNDVFESCYGLNAVYYTGDLHQWCNIQFGNTSSNPLYNAHDLVINNVLVTDLVIPETVTEIKPYAFCGATCLTSLAISNSVTSIGNNAFSYCSGLTMIEIPNSVTSIGNNAFSYCSGLTMIEIPNSVTSIGDYAFSSCSGLTSIEIPNSVTSIGNSAFSSCSGLTSIEIPNSITSIGSSAFSNCSGLTEVHYLGDIVEWCSIQFGNSYSNPLNNAHNLFINNALVTDLVIPETVTEIKPYAFYGATCLATLTISNSVTSIDSYAFYGCSGLTSLTFGNSVTSIGDGAFYNCYDIISITSFAETPPSLNTSSSLTFYDVSKTIPFCVPCGSEDEYASLSWGGFSNFYGMCGGTVTVTANPEEGIVTGDGTFEAGQTCTVTATAMEGYAFAKWTLNGVMISNCSEFTFYVSGDMTLMAHFVPNGNIVFADPIVKSICVSNWDINGDDELSYSEAASVLSLLSLEHRFAFNLEITSFGELQYFIGLNSIGASAFNGCSGLTFVVLPNSITSIDRYAFKNCSGLRGNLTIPNSVTSIGYQAFMGCSGLRGNLTIPNSVTSIGSYAFEDCIGLTSLTIGNSVTSIGNEAFYDCIGLTSLTVLAETPPTINNSSFYNCPKSIPVYVPCGSVEAYTVPHWGGFNNVFGLCGGTVTVAANPVEGGTVTGGGIVEADESCTVMANANEGYAFAKWTWNGIIVSTDAEYTFYVPSDMDLVAHFVPDGNITFVDATVKAICVAHWDTNGDGELSYAEAAVVTSLQEVHNYYSYFSNTEITSFNELQYFIGLTSIGNEAFYGCSGITSIIIPSSVTSIGSSAFSSSSNLTSMTVLADNPPTLGYDVFYSVNKGIPVYVPCGSVEAYTATHWGGFNNIVGFCGGTVSVAANPEEGGMVTGGGIIGADECCTVTAYANEGYAFSKWTWNGTMVSADAEYTFYVPNDMDLIAHFVPDGNITFADANVKAICIAHWDINGDGEMSYAEADVVMSLGEVFRSDTLISSFNELQYFIGLTSISNYAFSNCSSLTSIEIPNSVTSIGHHAFSGCTGLTSIEIPNSVTSLNGSAFSYCTGLTSIDIPNSVTSIGNNVFEYCSGLTSIEIPNSLTSIGSNVFSYCTGLTSIEIPNSVTSIGNYAFSGCTGLTSIEIPNSVTSISSTVFQYCSGLEQIIVDEGNTVYDSRENCNAIINTSTNALVVGCKNTVILNSVTSIGNYAFSYCTGLTSIEIPNSVTSIGNYAFSGCTGLTSIEIPNSVTSIGNYVFYYCTGLTTIEIPNSVISIEVWTFANCTGLTSIEIPNSVTSIGGYAFYNCESLESVIMLSQSVPSLGYSTFPSTNANYFIYVPYASLNDYKTATNWSNYEPRILPMAYATVPGYGVGNDKWVFIASPLSEDVIPTTIDNMLLGTNYDLYQFDQSATEEEWQNYKVDSFNLVNGQGYVYANEVEVNIIFKGVFNEDETKVVNLDYDAEKANPGWNLVGNPFPVDAYIDRPYYVMNEDGTAINPIAVPASTPIPPCVGVLVKANGTGESVTFSKIAPETKK